MVKILLSIGKFCASIKEEIGNVTGKDTEIVSNYPMTMDVT